MALFAIITTSCSNDDINIETTGRMHTLTYTVSTQQMYKDFTIEDDMLNFLRDKSLNIGVYTYVYNENGNKVEEAFSHQDNFNTISESFSLTEGKYTVISIETAVEPDEDYTTLRWTIEDVDKISTLKIKREYVDIRYPYVLGIATNYIEVGESDITINATPKPIGSLLQLKFYNFNESEYPIVAFGAQDVIDYYKVDPSIPRDDRYVTDLIPDDERHIMAEVDSDDKIKGVTRYVLDKEFEWIFLVKLPENINNDTWSSATDFMSGFSTLEDGKIYYGGMYYINDNYLPQVYLGSSSGFNTWLKEMEQFKNENTNPVPDIFMSWGSSVKSTQNGMTSYDLIAGGNGYAIYDEASGIYYLRYQGVGPVNLMTYYFSSETTGLYEVDLTYNKTESNFNMIVNYLASGYTLVETINDSLIVFESNDKKSVVGLMEANDYYALCFMDWNMYYGANYSPKSFLRIAENNKSKLFKKPSQYSKFISIESVKEQSLNIPEEISNIN